MWNLRLVKLRIVLSDTSQKLGPANPVWGRRTKRQLATVQIEDKAGGMVGHFDHSIDV